MASFDPSSRTVVARILYDGLGMAGKTRSLRSVQELFPTRAGQIYVPEENAAGRTLYFDWLEIEAGWLDDYPLRVQLLTVPGQMVYVQRRWMLLRSPDAVIAVVDSSPEALQRGAVGLRYLRAALDQLAEGAPPVLVQANKQDLPDALRGEALRAALEVPPELSVVETSAVSGDGIREALMRAMFLARDHVRAQLAGRSPSVLPPAESDPATMLESMRRAESEQADSLEGELLAERVLDDVAARSDRG